MSVFTFGGGHECECGRRLNNTYTTFEDDAEQSARDKMFKAWGPKWSMEYPTTEEAGVERFAMPYFETNTTDPTRCRCGAGTPPAAEPEPDPAARTGIWWFGASWGAPICDPCTFVELSPEHTHHCFACEGEIKAGDRGFVLAHVDEFKGVARQPWHRDCFLQSLGISV